MLSIGPLPYEKSTKNKHRYKAVETEDTRNPLGTIYIEKAALAQPPPRRIHVTLRLT